MYYEKNMQELAIQHMAQIFLEYIEKKQKTTKKLHKIAASNLMYGNRKQYKTMLLQQIC